MLQIVIDVCRYLDWCDLKGLKPSESKNLNEYVKLLKKGVIK